VSVPKLKEHHSHHASYFNFKFGEKLINSPCAEGSRYIHLPLGGVSEVEILKT